MTLRGTTGRSMGGHTSPSRGGSNDWITPRHVLDALGEFDLDPCACDPQPWQTAATMWTEHGLGRPWFGQVWLNPPYGRETIKWLRKLSKHGSGIALIFARTETEFFCQYVWPCAAGILFLSRRLPFCRPDGTACKHNSGGPSCLVAYGPECAERLLHSGLAGFIVDRAFRVVVCAGTTSGTLKGGVDATEEAETSEAH